MAGGWSSSARMVFRGTPREKRARMNPAVWQTPARAREPPAKSDDELKFIHHVIKIYSRRVATRQAYFVVIRNGAGRTRRAAPRNCTVNCNA